MANHVYFCHPADESYGLFVAARSRGKAKMIYAWETGDDYINIRSRISSKHPVLEEGVLDEDSSTLEALGLRYMTEDEIYGGETDG